MCVNLAHIYILFIHTKFTHIYYILSLSMLRILKTAGPRAEGGNKLRQAAEGGIKMEKWQEIQGYGGVYYISTLGQVKSFKQNKGAGRLLRPIKDRQYLRVSLYGEEGCGQIEKRLIHQLVAEAFLENPHGLKHLAHKNGDTKDNRVENLEWRKGEK